MGKKGATWLWNKYIFFLKHYFIYVSEDSLLLRAQNAIKNLNDTFLESRYIFLKFSVLQDPGKCIIINKYEQNLLNIVRCRAVARVVWSDGRPVESGIEGIMPRKLLAVDISCSLLTILFVVWLLTPNWIKRCTVLLDFWQTVLMWFESRLHQRLGNDSAANRW